MTAEHFETAVSALMALRPFKPFTVELNTRQRIEIDHPGACFGRMPPPFSGRRKVH